MRYRDLPHNFTGTCNGCGCSFSAYSPPCRPRKFCSQECGQRSMAGSKQTEDHIAKRIKSGSGHPNWKGNLASRKTGRCRALRMFPSRPCEHCGEAKAERHHVDGNTLNNEPTNIQFLCRACHLALHDFTILGAIRHDGRN